MEIQAASMVLFIEKFVLKLKIKNSCPKSLLRQIVVAFLTLEYRIHAVCRKKRL